MLQQLAPTQWLRSSGVWEPCLLALLPSLPATPPISCPPHPPCVQAAYPLPWVRAAKFWPTTSRVDNVYGDRNLVLTLPKAQAAAAAAADEPQAMTA